MRDGVGGDAHLISGESEPKGGGGGRGGVAGHTLSQSVATCYNNNADGNGAVGRPLLYGNAVAAAHLGPLRSTPSSLTRDSSSRTLRRK